MKKIFASVIAAASVLLFWGCPSNGGDNIEKQIGDFCEKSTFGVYNGNRTLFEFEPEEWQIVFSAADQTSRLQRDDQTIYAHYELTGEIVENGTVKVTVVARGIDAIAVRNHDMTIKKIEDGKLWLWQADKQYGHLIYWEK